MALTAGAKLGPYEVLGAIGAGGMGQVYQARDPRLSRSVAIKVLRPDLSGDPEREARFEREAHWLARRRAIRRSAPDEGPAAPSTSYLHSRAFLPVLHQR
jgi:serine/threonine protein kinase